MEYPLHGKKNWHKEVVERIWVLNISGADVRPHMADRPSVQTGVTGHPHPAVSGHLPWSGSPRVQQCLPDQCPYRASSALQWHLSSGEPPLCSCLRDPGVQGVQHLPEPLQGAVPQASWRHDQVSWQIYIERNCSCLHHHFLRDFFEICFVFIFGHVPEIVRLMSHMGWFFILIQKKQFLFSFWVMWFGCLAGQLAVRRLHRHCWGCFSGSGEVIELRDCGQEAVIIY